MVAPRGEILVSAGRDEETLKVVAIEPQLADDKEIFRNNDLLKDRRPDIY